MKQNNESTNSNAERHEASREGSSLSPEINVSAFQALLVLALSALIYSLYFGHPLIQGPGYYLYTQRVPEKLEAALNKEFSNELASRKIRKVSFKNGIRHLKTTVKTDDTTYKINNFGFSSVDDHVFHADNKGALKLYWSLAEGSTFDDALNQASNMIKNSIKIYDEKEAIKSTWE